MQCGGVGSEWGADNSDIDILTKHNQDVNASALEEDEILGTKAYFYQKGRGFIL